MKLDQLTTIDQLAAFLDGAQPCIYQAQGTKDERYAFIQQTLVQFGYLRLNKAEKGVLIRYLTKLSGYSRQQVTRLINQYKANGKCVRKQQALRGFSRIYTDDDTRMLAKMDELHGTPCGAIMKIFFVRALEQGDDAFKRLAGISASHIYNLRGKKIYQNIRINYTKTTPKPSNIAERKKPNTNGKPGYLRVDTVHQGDEDKRKGVYHINLVDDLIQYSVQMSLERISERFMIPALERAIAIFPYKILGFHSDNGSEFINHRVADMLDKLNIEFTKSRSRKTNDNALAECKNASIVRKHFGHSHIDQGWADDLNGALQEPLHRYTNYHKPCHFPTVIINEKGKQKKVYLQKNIMTPYEKFLQLDNPSQYLKEGVTLNDLARYAGEMTDKQAAEVLQNAKREIFSKIFSPKMAG